VLECGFLRAGFQRIYASTALENVASERVVERIGMRFEGVRPVDGVPERCYSIGSKEFCQSHPPGAIRVPTPEARYLPLRLDSTATPI
jgi:hypothetical protein